MSKSTFAASAPWLALGGTAAAVAVAVGLYVSGALFPERTPGPEPEPVAEAQSDAIPTEDPVPEDVTEDVVALSEEPALPVETEDETDASEPAPESEPDTQTVLTEATPAPEETDDQETVTLADEDGVTAPVQEDTVAGTAPEFDIVRVAPDGQTLIAGSALGARLVRIMIDGVEVGDAAVDGTGKFVAFFDLPSSDQPRIVSLLSEGDLGPVESQDQVIIAPSVQQALVEDTPDTSRAEIDVTPEPPVDSEETVADVLDESTETPQRSVADADTAVEQTQEIALADQSKDLSQTNTSVTATVTVEAVILPDPEGTSVAPTEVPQQAAPPTASDLTTTAIAALPEAAQPVAPLQPVVSDAPAVILSTEDGVEVLQSAGAAPVALDQIALDAIAYEDAGAVALTGRGTADEFVRVYIDNQPILTTEVAPDGRWRADLPDIDSGTYTLRVDAVDSEGTVTSRVESPFLREDPELLAQAIERGEAAATVQVVTVQPGNTLWAIARDRYGEGPAYVRVFEANRDRIRDPDLIYPGQVFSIPN